MPQTHTFRFTLSEPQFCRAHRDHLRRHFLNPKSLALITLALGVGSIQARMFGNDNVAIWAFGALWLGILGFMAYAFMQLPRKLYRRDADHLAEHEFQVADGQLKYRAGASEQLLDASKISRLHTNREFIFIYGASALPWIIPRSVFGGEAEIQELFSFLKKR